MNNSPNWNNSQPNNQNNQPAVNSNLPNQPTNNQSSWLIQLAGAVLPALLEQFTGQKMTPNNNSSNPETQLVLSQMLSIQQQILTNQQAFNQRITALETNASDQFNNLIQQVQSIKSIRLSHSKETKAIDYNLQPEPEN